jgi:hypothetical protein
LSEVVKKQSVGSLLSIKNKKGRAASAAFDFMSGDFMSGRISQA